MDRQTDIVRLGNSHKDTKTYGLKRTDRETNTLTQMDRQTYKVRLRDNHKDRSMHGQKRTDGETDTLTDGQTDLH
jgi:hypothetical protein